MARRVQGAVACGGHFQLREAVGGVGVQLQPGHAGARGVARHASGGRVAHRQQSAEALRLVAFGREQHIGGGIHDPGPGGAAGMPRDGPHRARDRSRHR